METTGPEACSRPVPKELRCSRARWRWEPRISHARKPANSTFQRLPRPFHALSCRFLDVRGRISVGGEGPVACAAAAASWDAMAGRFRSGSCGRRHAAHAKCRTPASRMLSRARMLMADGIDPTRSLVTMCASNPSFPVQSQSASVSTADTPVARRRCSRLSSEPT